MSNDTVVRTLSFNQNEHLTCFNLRNKSVDYKLSDSQIRLIEYQSLTGFPQILVCALYCLLGIYKIDRIIDPMNSVQVSLSQTIPFSITIYIIPQHHWVYRDQN